MSLNYSLLFPGILQASSHACILIKQHPDPVLQLAYLRLKDIYLALYHLPLLPPSRTLLSQPVLKFIPLNHECLPHMIQPLAL